MTAYRLIKNTAKAGNTVLGAGCYSAALESFARDDTVIKIGNNMSDPWITYYEQIIAKMQDNPCVPKVKSFYIDYNNEYYVCVMERLQDSCPVYANREAAFEAVRQYLYGEISRKKFVKRAKKLPEQFPNIFALVELMDYIVRWTDAFTEEDAEDLTYSDDYMGATKLDMHSGNVMFRGYELVITDPWCNVEMTDVPSVCDWADENLTDYEWN